MNRKPKIAIVIGAVVIAGLALFPGCSEGTSERGDPAAMDLILVKVGPNKIQVIKIVREVTGLGLADAKRLVESAPILVERGLPGAEANRLRDQLSEVGAEVRLE